MHRLRISHSQESQASSREADSREIENFQKTLYANDEVDKAIELSLGD